jgi:hypothetical protein
LQGTHHAESGFGKDKTKTHDKKGRPEMGSSALCFHIIRIRRKPKADHSQQSQGNKEGKHEIPLQQVQQIAFQTAPQKGEEG